MMKQGQGHTWLCVVHDFNISVGLRGFSRDVPIPNGDFFRISGRHIRSKSGYKKKEAGDYLAVYQTHP